LAFLLRAFAAAFDAFVAIFFRRSGDIFERNRDVSPIITPLPYASMR
jgi:hypothetical protein